MRERALTFGPDGILVGILTEPDPEAVLPDAPALIVLNAGIIHRVGASRMNVGIARAAAERGFTTFRFDFSGVGDSGTRRDSLPIRERFVIETREAMDYVSEVTGSTRFVVGGLCSGADGAFWSALEDDRIRGVWQIDPLPYRTLGYYLRRYGPKLLSPRAWVHSIRVRLPAKDEAGREEIFVAPEYQRVVPPRKVVRDGLATLLEREVALYFLLTGGSEMIYEDQVSDAFSDIGLRGRACIRYMPEAAHTVTGLEHKRFLIEDLTAWFREHWDQGYLESGAGGQ